MQDWPLAVCDPSTIKKDSLIAGDVVFEDMAMENVLVHHDVKQQWYYIRDQQADEAWIFVQGDNRSGYEHKCQFAGSNQDASPRFDHVLTCAL